MKPLLISALALAAASPAFAERGSDGEVKILYWQAPTLLNPYLSASGKDADPASLVVEPLAVLDPDGKMQPRLAAEIPTVENGGVAADFTSITWKLKPGLMWSDGTPLTAKDVKFTADYCMDPEGGCAAGARFGGIASVETPDDLTVKINFAEPKFFPWQAFVGARSPVLQAAQFADCLGTRAATCSQQNFHPIGSGPYVVTDFRTNDVATFAINEHYRDAAKPAFATVMVKGGGDPTASGRAVLETGEFDFAWNLQLAPEQLAEMEARGRGVTFASFGTMVERIELNQTDPSSDLPEGERSTVAHPHPILTDPAVRKALSMAIDRALLVEIGYGPAGQPTCNVIPAPPAFASDNTECLTQDIEGAKKLLDEAGWLPGADGIREKDGKRLQFLYQTSVNAVRQDVQALVKQWWSEIGVGADLKTVDGSVFFGGDAGSPDTFQKFYADIQMYTNSFDSPDPETFTGNFRCDRIPSPETQWQGDNSAHVCDPAYDELQQKLRSTPAQEDRTAIVKQLNDMLTKDSHMLLPLVHRGMVSARANSLNGIVPNAWESDLWNIQDWSRAK